MLLRMSTRSFVIRTDTCAYDFKFACCFRVITGSATFLVLVHSVLFTGLNNHGGKRQKNIFQARLKHKSKKCKFARMSDDPSLHMNLIKHLLLLLSPLGLGDLLFAPLFITQKQWSDSERKLNEIKINSNYHRFHTDCFT